MPTPLFPDTGPAPEAPPSPPSAPAAVPAQALAGGRELATLLPEWDLLPPSNVVAFRRGPR